MGTPNLHRKLIDDLINTTVSFPFCVLQCNPQLNSTGLCSSGCIIFCPSFCHTTESSPTPSPANSPYSQSTPLDHHHHSPLSLPLKISLIFLIATFISTLYKFYTIWFRSRRHRPPPTPSPENQVTDDHDHYHVHNDFVDHPIWYIRTTGLQPLVIDAITVVKFSKTDCVIEGTDCSVCLTEFEIDDMLRLLPNCKHAFHISCIDTWLLSHTNCPLCRAGIENNSLDVRSPELNNGDSGFTRETNLGVSIMRDGDQGEASGSSVLRIGETDEQDVNNNVSKREGSN